MEKEESLKQNITKSDSSENTQDEQTKTEENGQMGAISVKQSK